MEEAKTPEEAREDEAWERYWQQAEREEEEMRASKEEVNDKYYDEEDDDELWEKRWQEMLLERSEEADVVKKVKVGNTVKKMDIKVTIYVSTNRMEARIIEMTGNPLPMAIFIDVYKGEKAVIARIMAKKLPILGKPKFRFKWSVVSLDLKEKDFDKIREKVLGIIGDYPIKIINIVRAVKFLSKKIYSLCNIDLRSKNLLQLDGKLTIKRKYEDNRFYTY